MEREEIRIERSALDAPAARMAGLLLALMGPVAGAQCELEKISAIGGQAGDNFGDALALNTEFAVVGARSDGEAGPSAGAIHVYDAATMTFLGKLLGPSDYAWFGASVDLDGGRAVVGAELADVAFTFDLARREPLAELVAVDGELHDSFGESVSIEAQHVIVGAPFHSAVGMWSGAAYVFDAQAGAQRFKLVPRDAAPVDHFGGDVALSANLAVIGAWADDDAGTASGSAYVFDVTTGKELFKLVASDGAPGDHFGEYLAVDGDRAIIGAWGHDVAGESSGAAYVFDLRTGRELGKLTASDGEAYDVFGAAVDIAGDRAIVGAAGDDDLGADSGSAYVFDVVTGRQLYKLTASDGAASGGFGASRAVALSRDRVLVGAYGDNEWAGASYVFQDPRFANPYGFGNGCPCANDSSLGGCSNSSGTGGVLGACGSNSASVDGLRLIASALPPNAVAVIAAATDWTQAPFGDGLLCLDGAVVPLSTGHASSSGIFELGPGIGTNGLPAGTRLSFQCGYLDPDGPCGSGFNLTNALAVELAP